MAFPFPIIFSMKQWEKTVKNLEISEVSMDFLELGKAIQTWIDLGLISLDEPYDSRDRTEVEAENLPIELSFTHSNWLSHFLYIWENHEKIIYMKYNEIYIWIIYDEFHCWISHVSWGITSTRRSSSLTAGLAATRQAAHVGAQLVGGLEMAAAGNG